MTAFDFESLLEAWESAGMQDAFPSIRALLSPRAPSIIDILPNSQLPMALAAFQREGEMLVAQRKFAEARGLYESMRRVVEDWNWLLGRWCAGAEAECRMQLGEVADGLADLAELLEELEDRGEIEAVEAVASTISEWVERGGY